MAHFADIAEAGVECSQASQTAWPGIELLASCLGNTFRATEQEDALVREAAHRVDLHLFHPRRPVPQYAGMVYAGRTTVHGDGSCGAIDNWTGIVTIAQIYRTIKDMNFNKSLVFVGFGKEEKGMVGSKAMVKQFRKEEVKQYCAMINVDSLGLSNPQVMTNISHFKLQKLASEEAARLAIPFQFVNIKNASSDSAPFMDKNIPALTIASLPSEWPDVFHSKHDQANRIKIENPLRPGFGSSISNKALSS